MANPRSAKSGNPLGLLATDAMAWGFVILVATLFVANTQHGIGVLPDTTRYMQIVSTPYDAPLYPWILSAGHLAGLDLEHVALFAGFVLYIANALLILHLFRYALPDQPLFVAIGTLLVIISPTYLWANTIAMSESLFMALMLLSVAFFLSYLEKQDRRVLAASSLSVGMAMLARFVAPAIGASFATVILFYNRQRTMAERVYDTAMLFLLSAGIFITWAVGSKLLVGRAVGRQLTFYGNADSDRWLSGLSALASFLLPSQVPQLVRLALLALVVSIAVFVVISAAWRNWGLERPFRQDVLILVFGFFNFFYLIFIILSVLIEANLQLNNRYSMPFYVGLVFVLVIAAANFSGRLNRAPVRRSVVITGLAMLLAINALRSAVQTAEAYDQGIGFQSLTWRTSPTVAAVRALPEDAIVFTNGSDALNFLTGRRTNWIPAHSQRRTGLENEENPFEEQVQRLRQALVEQKAYVVILDAIDWRFYFPSEDELVKRADLKLVQSDADGRIYQADVTPDGKLQSSN
ncbi:glycosyltransferase family 39 protein [Rhizobium sp. LjRoot98]|uniref:hypothetical protein n=1 Tax=Rhizobium sp. LjRoot98 TaxID=3342345 RepID=UPI003ECD289C